MARTYRQSVLQPAEHGAARRAHVRGSEPQTTAVEGRVTSAAAAMQVHPGRLTPGQVLRLQAALGNRAVRRALAGPGRPAISAAGRGQIQRAAADITLDAVDLARKVVALVTDRRADESQLAEAKRQADEVLTNLDEDADARRLAINVSGLVFKNLAREGPRLELLAREIIESHFRYQAQASEQRDQGHSLGRHGPEVTDPKLKRRLETGIAPDDVYSPAPGLSTRFASYEAWVKTRQVAVTILDAAIAKTRKRLAPAVAAYFKAKNTYDQTPPGPAKAPNQPLAQAVTAAKNNVQAQVEVLNLEAPNLNFIQVRFVPAQAAAAQLIEFKAGYTIIKDHGMRVGDGYRGTAQNPADPALYARTEKVESITQSRTGIEPTNAQPLMEPGAVHQPANWTVFQHFPTVEPKEGIFS